MKPRTTTCETVWQWAVLVALSALIALALVHALDRGWIFKF